MNIALDIGHTQGRIQPNGVDEHQLAATVAAALAETLRQAGHSVQTVDFPHLGNSADLTKTAAAINTAAPHISISLHADWSDNPAAKGAHVCHYPGSAKGKRLAACIAAHLTAPDLLPGRADKTVPRGDLYILRATKCPAVLVECGFMGNAHDLDILRNSPHRIAAAITHGVEDYAKDLANRQS